jgi:hypothetical protein
MTHAPPGPRPEDHFPKVSKPLCERQPLLGLRLRSSEGRFGFPQQGFSTQPCQNFSYVLHAETLEVPLGPRRTAFAWAPILDPWPLAYAFAA